MPEGFDLWHGTRIPQWPHARYHAWEEPCIRAWVIGPTLGHHGTSLNYHMWFPVPKTGFWLQLLKLWEACSMGLVKIAISCATGIKHFV